MALKRPAWKPGTVVLLEHDSKILRGNALRDPHVRKLAVWLPLRGLLFLVSIAVGLVACGGGGGGDSSPSPQPPVTIALTLEAAGSVIPGAAVVPNASRVITTRAELDEFVGRAGGKVFAEFRTVNFAINSVIYLEGPGDNDAASSARIASAATANGINTIQTEICGVPAANPSGHRPFALYLVPANIQSATFITTQRSRPTCSTVDDIPATRVAVGDLPHGTAPLVSPTRVIRDAAGWATISSRIPTLLPPGYAPDFDVVTLIYLESADNDASSYLRIVQTLENSDNSVDVGYEYCGSTLVMLPTHLPFALYSIPKHTAAIRLNIQVNLPPNCATSR